MLVSPAALASVSGIAFARGNADAPETARNLADVVVADLRSRRRVDLPAGPPPDVTAQVRITRLPFVFNPFTRCR